MQCAIMPMLKRRRMLCVNAMTPNARRKKEQGRNKIGTGGSFIR
jgi:hypothetical protein